MTKEQLIKEVTRYASSIKFKKEFEGSFFILAVIDNVEVIFFNEVGGRVKSYLVFPYSISLNTRQKIELVQKALNELDES